MNRIASTLEQLQQEIAKTYPKSESFQGNVRLIAVSKRQSVQKIIALAKQGQMDFAENQLQEALQKMSYVNDLKEPFRLNWHFIGTIQSRKCSHIAKNFNWVQSIDRIKVAEKLNTAREGMPPLNVCLQINLFDEPQKSGVLPSEVKELAQYVETQPNLTLRGIMALPPIQTNPLEQARQFNEIANFYNHLKINYPKMDTLSMGMSNDFPIAIEAGSNMIRVGTRLFGERS